MQTTPGQTFDDWLCEVHRILVRSVEYHFPNFDQWDHWFAQGKTPQEAADMFVGMLAQLPE